MTRKLKAKYIIAVFLGLIFTMFFPSSLFAVEFVISEVEVDGDNIQLRAFVSDFRPTSCPDRKCYLLGTLRAVGTSNYFGLTRGSTGEWIAYKASFDKEVVRDSFAYCEVVSASCEALVEMRVDTASNFFLGPGEYEVKLRRFTGGSKNHTQESNVHVVYVSLDKPSTPSPMPTATPVPVDVMPDFAAEDEQGAIAPAGQSGAYTIAPEPALSEVMAESAEGAMFIAPEEQALHTSEQEVASAEIPPVALVMMSGGVAMFATSAAAFWKTIRGKPEII